MAEYIEREKVFKLIKEQKEKETGAYSKGRNTGLFVAMSIIKNKEVLPTADVVKVVRCKDCKHKGWVQEPCHGKTIDYCKIHDLCIRENDFCSYGEMKEVQKNDRHRNN